MDTTDQRPEQKFREALKQILTVPKTEILRREAEYKKSRSSKKEDQ